MSRTVDDVAEEIAVLAAQIGAATCRWLGLIAEFDAREGYREWGQASCAEWVAWRCGLSVVTAREHVRIARWLMRHEAVRAAFGAGELSYSKVRALARLEDVARADELLVLAREATAAELERIVAGARRVTRQDAARQVASRFLDAFFDDDGCLVLRARIPGDDGALVLRALEDAMARLQASGDGAAGDAEVADEPGRARHADALVRVAVAALGADDRVGSVADHRQVVVHVDVATLAGTETAAVGDAAGDSAGSPTCRLHDGPAIAAETARRLCCDAGIVTTTERDGRTLSVGRRRRSVPPAIRRALRRRHATCAFPGCTRTRWLDAHHIEHWAHGGPTSLDNLVHLCHHHHRLVHEGGYEVRRAQGDELEFCSPSGRRLARTARPPRGDCDRLVAEQRRAGIDPPPDAAAPRATWQPWDLPMAVDNVLGWTSGPGPDARE